MLRRNLQKLTLGAAVMAAALTVDVPQANAFWHWFGGGSWGGGYYGSSGGSWGGSWGGYPYYTYGGYGYGYGYGHHAYRRAYRRWGHYSAGGGSWGGYYAGYGWGSSGGSSGGYYVGYGSSGGSSGGSTGGMIVAPPASGAMPSPAAPPTTAPEVESNKPTPMEENELEKPAPEGSDSTGIGGPELFNATLNVTVPADALVFVNGRPTTSTGAERHYVSKGLTPGYTYTYELRAEVVRNGQTLTETKEVKLEAGQATNLAFAFADAKAERVAAEPVRTSLTLHVPAAAKVYLSGNATRSHGEVRQFTTTKLALGESWGDYVVRVEVERDGQTLTEERTISLAGGDARELSIDFDAPQVAQAADRN